ncbi:hypothetical protein M8494_37515 [Serratia ureilytica]
MRYRTRVARREQRARHLYEMSRGLSRALTGRHRQHQPPLPLQRFPGENRAAAAAGRRPPATDGRRGRRALLSVDEAIARWASTKACRRVPAPTPARRALPAAAAQYPKADLRPAGDRKPTTCAS